ncbi:MAG: glycoside hydrolase family 3 N-terminal domain-containing protein, partial [Acidobacteriota bacterium]
MRSIVVLATAALFGLLGQGAPKPATKPAPKLTAEQRTAQAMLRSLNLHDRVAQLVIGVCYGDVPGSHSKDYVKFRHWVRDLHIGGFIMNNRVQYGLVRNAEPHAMALFFNQMQKLSKTPLLIAGDFERSSSMRVSDTIRYPFNMAYAAARDVEASRHQGLATAREARALGVQWVFAPVADVNNNPLNPVINLRSYGENPKEVAQHVAAYIDGAHSDPKNIVLVSAKHFPG